jgi:thioredoxin-related protein
MKSVFAFVIALVLTAQASGEIKFLRGTLAEAVETAKSQKKPLMIDFITDWCRWCDTLDARTYSDQDVASYITSHVVPFKIDAEKGEGIDLAKKYGVSGYPTILFIHPEGEEIDRILGYVEAKPFLDRVTDYVNGRNTLPALLKEVQSRPDDAALHYTLATKYSERNNSVAAAEHFKKVIALDPNNTLQHNEEAEFEVASSAFKGEKDPAPLEKFVEKYPKSEMVRGAYSTLWRSYTKAKEGERARKYFESYLSSNPTDARAMNAYAWGCAENGVNLDHAAAVAQKAVEISTKPDERASYLDTYATVEFARGNSARAIELEEQALATAKTIPNAKLTEYEKALAKFKSDKKSTTK